MVSDALQCRCDIAFCGIHIEPHGLSYTVRPNKKCGSGYPAYTDFLPPALTFFLHFGQTLHPKKKMKGKACILKDVFLDMNPIALKKAKVYNFDLLSAIGLKK